MELLIFISILAAVGFTVFIITYINNYDNQITALNTLKKVLQKNNKKELENFLIVHENQLPKETCDKIRVKIDEFIIEEDQEQERRKFNA